MKLLILALVLVLANIASAQQIPPPLQTISAQDSGTACSVSGSCAVWSLPNQPTVTIQITGTCSCTLTFESTSDRQTWFSVTATNLSTGTASTTTTSSGQYSLANTGMVSVRVRATTFVSGGLDLKATQGWASIARGGGGGVDPAGITTAKVTGGSATTSTLTLQSTSGVGTTGADIIFKTGNNGGTEGFRVSNDGHLSSAKGLLLTGVLGTNAGFRVDSSLEIATAGVSGMDFGPLLSIFNTTNPGDITSETAIALGAYDGSGAIKKITSIFARWSNTNGATGYGRLGLNATSGGGGTNSTDMMIFGAHGITVFQGDNNNAPGANIFSVSGTIAASTGIFITPLTVPFAAPFSTLFYVGKSAGGPDPIFERASGDASGTDFNWYKSRGSLTARTIVQSGDSIGDAIFRGYDGSAHRPAAMIEGLVDTTPGANDMPGRLSFKTTPDGSITLAERMRIDSAGRLIQYGPTVTSGTVPGISGCSAGTQVGGPVAGEFASGTNGACTVTLTFTPAAPNGWSCWAANSTTPANLYQQSGSSTTTAVFTGTTVSGDVIHFGCQGY